MSFWLTREVTMEGGMKLRATARVQIFGLPCYQREPGNVLWGTNVVADWLLEHGWAEFWLSFCNFGLWLIGAEALPGYPILVIEELSEEGR